MATIVFSKVGACGLPAISSISLRLSAIPVSRAGFSADRSIESKAGTPP